MDILELQEYYPDELGIKRIENNADKVEIFMKTTTQRATCPKCGKITDKKVEYIVRPYMTFRYWENR